MYHIHINLEHNEVESVLKQFQKYNVVYFIQTKNYGVSFTVITPSVEDLVEIAKMLDWHEVAMFSFYQHN